MKFDVKLPETMSETILEISPHEEAHTAVSHRVAQLWFAAWLFL